MILQCRLQYSHRSGWMFANSAPTYRSVCLPSPYLINALFRLSFSNFILVMLSWAARLIPFNSSIFFSISSSVIVYIPSLSIWIRYLTSVFDASQPVYNLMANLFSAIHFLFYILVQKCGLFAHSNAKLHRTYTNFLFAGIKCWKVDSDKVKQESTREVSSW